ncbi:MAG: VCBS repeat-containing protein, partial [Limisphaerales bacterium]
MEHYRLYPLLQMPVGGFRNLGNGQFTETTTQWGLDHPGINQGLATGDFDQDGDLDLVVNRLNSPALILRNESPAPRVMVKLKGKTPNTAGIGAHVTLLGGAVRSQSREMIAGGRYQSGCDPVAVFASGKSTAGMTLEVRWRNRTRSVIANVKANRLYEIDEAVATSDSRPAPPAPPALFEDVSARIAHRHHEPDFDDYERQPLLPFKLSQAGPAAAWFDLDGDGHEDLVLGAGRGGAPAIFRGDGRGAFEAIEARTSLAAVDDTTGLVGWDDGAGNRRMLTGIGGYEVVTKGAGLNLGMAAGLLVDGGPFGSELPGASALAMGDPGGDGRMVLFVGGGVSPGHYPLGRPSAICRYDGRAWRPDTRNSVVLENLGIVNGAVWSDLDGDGFAELVLACEWGPIRVFRHQAGALFEITRELGLEPFTGWWRGVTAGDLNGDGRMDLIAANWGFNSPYRASIEKPLVFAHGQIAQPGVTEIIETEWVGDVLAPSRQFMAMANSMPYLVESFATHKAYSEASLEDVLGERAPLARRVTATTLASTAFLNTGNGFKPIELPPEAQFAPAFSVNVADFDGDGHEDVFLSQNFFALQPEIPRIDAGKGLWLRGDGTGGLAAVPPARSGLQIHGEQRGAAVADFDGDGRPDLVVTQNGAATRLFRNREGAIGLRVRLQGRPGNPHGVGAVMRLQFQDRQGPAREIHAGSGYWSQDASTQVLATPEKPVAIWIRWPGGSITTTAIPPNSKEITVNLEGRLVSSR